MKTAQVLRRLAWHEWGGIETVVVATARGLEARDVGAEILCTAALDGPGLDRRRGLTVRRYRYGYTRLPPWPSARRALDLKGGNPTSPGLLAHLLTAPGLDLVSCHTMGRLGGHVRWACRVRRIPYVVTLHGGHFVVPSGERERLRRPTRGSIDLGRPLDRLLGTGRYLQDAAAIIALSPQELDAARQALPDTPSFGLRNGVDVAHFAAPDLAAARSARVAEGPRAAADPEPGRAFRAAHRIPQGAPLVLCVARLDPQKGQDRLVDAVARAGEPWHLVLVGPESVAGEAKSLQQRAQQRGLGARLHLIGGLAPTDPRLVQAYHAADVVALASRHEPFGVVLLEAWAAARPVIATRTGGIPSFVTHEQDGLLVPPGPTDDAVAEGFARALTHLRAHPADAQRLARAGRARAAHYDWSAVAADLESIYHQALHHHRTRRSGAGAQPS